MSAAHEARDVPGIDYITPPMSAAHEARDVPPIHTTTRRAGGARESTRTTRYESRTWLAHTQCLFGSFGTFSHKSQSA